MFYIIVFKNKFYKLVFLIKTYLEKTGLIIIASGFVICLDHG
nr:hypothetical protein CJLB15_00034 [Campylobacter phage CJLB-15]